MVQCSYHMKTFWCFLSTTKFSVKKRLVQNLKGVDFNEDSDEDKTCDPVTDDENITEQFFDCIQCSLTK